jgi:hypothetical protein
VAPGLVDNHRHMWQGILRNVLPDGSLDDYIATVQKIFGANYTPDDVYAGDYFSALGAIDIGVTCILDWPHIHNTPAHTDAAIKALMDSGARAVLAYGRVRRGRCRRAHHHPCRSVDVETSVPNDFFAQMRRCAPCFRCRRRMSKIGGSPATRIRRSS